jgi:hypothetical protein
VTPQAFRLVGNTGIATGELERIAAPYVGLLDCKKA